MIYEQKTIYLPEYTTKLVELPPFCRKRFPHKVISEVYETIPISEKIDFIALSRFYDNFDTNTSFLYRVTQLNGITQIGNGYCLQKPGTTTEVGYSKIQTRQSFDMTKPYTIKTELRVKFWYKGSDLGVGFSLVNATDTAYRGDLACWIDFDTIRLFARRTRTSATLGRAGGLIIGRISLTTDDLVHIELTHSGSTTRIVVVKNGVRVVDWSGTTYNYTTMYGVLGSRDGKDIAGQRTTELWYDYLHISTPKPPMTITNLNQDWQTIIQSERRDMYSFNQKEVSIISDFTKKVIDRPVWS